MKNSRKSSERTFTVTSIKWKGHVKRLTLEPGGEVLNVPLSACLSQGDQVRITDGYGWVLCRNGAAQFLQPYIEEDSISVGGLRLELLLKEITEAEEFEAYKSLSEFHYRNHSLYGRTARLIVRAFHPMYPQVLGYVELASPFYMNKARATVLNAPFDLDGVRWEAWDMPTTRQYIHLIVRIARCVVYPEFRGLGLGQVLIRHAMEFARTRWQVANLIPCFIEISADMLKYVPFAEKAGMHFIGETEGNLSRVAKDLEYLTRNAARVRSGEIVSEESCGIVDQQVARMERALRVMRREGLSREELLQRLSRLSYSTVLRDFALFHEMVSLPKPTYLKGLCPGAEEFLQQRLSELTPSKNHKPKPLRVSPLAKPISIRDLSVTFISQVRRTLRTHAIQQAFGISPESINTDVIREMSVEINPGEVVLIIGPSGSGKTTLLTLLAESQLKGIKVKGKISFPRNFKPGSFQTINSQKPLIEVLGCQDIPSALHLMGSVGLSDAFIYLKRFEELSKGQQYRAMLARLIAQECNVWLVDEFCTNLDPVTANVVADKLQSLARKLGVGVVAAAPHCETFLASLRPDKVIQLTSAWEHTIRSGEEFSRVMPQNQSQGEVSKLRLFPEYIAAVRRGEKQSTIRKGHRYFPLGIMLLESDTQRLTVRVTEVLHKRLRDLTEEDARRDGFHNLSELHNALKAIYLNIGNNSAITVVRFEPLLDNANISKNGHAN